MLRTLGCRVLIRKTPVAMTIAGSDSGGGAGIQADLKTFSALGVHGTTAITSITAQNTVSVNAIYDLPAWIVYEQIKTVYEDLGIDAAKTGMLSNRDIIKAVAKAIEEFNIKLVIDPVMVAKSGARLLKEDAVETFKRDLIPKATIITPNVPEASILAGFRVETLEDAVRAAKIIHELYGIEAVVVKGGHLFQREVVDVVYFKGEYYYLKSERFLHGCFHGAGCSYSAAITAYLAKGYTTLDAIREAKRFIDMAIQYGIKVGKGHCPVNPMAYLEIPALKYMAYENVRRAVEIILENQSLILPFTPEVGINVVEAIDHRYARNILDVIGVEGRIVKAGNKLVRVGDVKPGGSSHLARLVLALLKYGYDVRAALNVKYDQLLIDKALKKGLKVIYIDRSREPSELKQTETGTMEWIASQVSTGNTELDIIYDKGDLGKEPMIRILGRNAIEIVEKLISILK
ncbi:MAG: bifunctional hydroxymethylpyrimidine kinase/phosphomethylpyrimidine kinase [Desulfurococcaceae archaeon]